MIIRNSLITPDGTELISRHRRDFVQYVDTTTAKTYGVDGGLDYLRRTGETQDCVDTSIIVDDNAYGEEIVRQNLVWGSYGRDGNDPLRYIPLAQMEADHIENILRGHANNIHPFYRKAFEHELKIRNEERKVPSESGRGDIRQDV